MGSDSEPEGSTARGSYTKLNLDKDVDIIKLIGWLKMTALEHFTINWILVEFV